MYNKSVDWNELLVKSTKNQVVKIRKKLIDRLNFEINIDIFWRNR